MIFQTGKTKEFYSFKRAPKRFLWQKFAIFSGVRLVRSAGSLYDMRTNPGEANGFFKIQPTYFL